MEARRLRVAVLATMAVLFSTAVSSAGSHRTQNFIVTAPSAQLAQEIGDSAEAFREKLALEWLGRPLPPWSEPCPITAQVSPNLGAGGATSFYFDRGRPFGFTMNIQGTRERVLDSVLPHEVTHTIFATHFGRPLPRWADEGACTTVEHTSERTKQEKFLLEFLTTNRGIAFNKMFAMKEYPRDVLPLYSQGYSLARFFIAQGGKPKFVQYVGDGMRSNNWAAATSTHYGFKDLSELQLTWVEWVRNGSSEPDAIAYSPLSPNRHPSVAHLASGRTPTAVPGTQVALASTPTPPTANFNTDLVPAVPTAGSSTSAMVPTNFVRPASYSGNPNAVAANPNAAPTNFASGGGWYARQRDQVKAGLPPVEDTLDRTAGPAARMATNNEVPFQMMSRQQPPEQARQLILEWSRPGPGPSGAPTMPGGPAPMGYNQVPPLSQQPAGTMLR